MLKNTRMSGTRFSLDLNLRSLSMISIAVKLWDSQDIKNRIKNFFLNYEHPNENWCDISKLVVQYGNSIKLAPSLSVLLKETILHIGIMIHDWVFHVTKILKLGVTSTEKIYFSFGAVDEIKIFDLYWRDLMASDKFIYQSDYFKHSPLFSLACMYGCERFVKERKNEMLDELSKFYPEVKTGDEIYNIMSVSICLTAKERILENVASPQRMFEVCLEAGFSKAARYYWEKLDEVEKVSNLTNFAKNCFLRQYESNFLMGKRCENLLFLINQMGEEEWWLFVTDYADEIIRLFLPIWPYQELIVDLLEYDWNIESSKLRKMVDNLNKYSRLINRLKFSLVNDLLFQIMQKAWANIPFDEKLVVLKENHGEKISSFFLSCNSKILNIVFNDPSITEIDGEKMDVFIKRGFEELVKKGKFDFLDEIIETVFNFIPKPKEYLKETFLDDTFDMMLLTNDESFGVLDQFLDWLAESEADRARLRNEIDFISVCTRLMLPPWLNFKQAKRFLKWRLETDAEVKRFKEEMKSYNFVIAGYPGYIRIKSGDLSWLRPGDSLAIHPDENPFGNAVGLTFLKFEDATELNRGVVLGIKSFRSGVDYGFLGPDCCHAKIERVDYVGTEVGDYIVHGVRKIWYFPEMTYFDIYKAVTFSNAFIKFYYETDEEVLEFKKTKLPALVTENLIEFLIGGHYLRCHMWDNFLDEFCKFCMISSDKIEEFKIQQRIDIEKFLDTYVIDKRRFTLADIYLDWLFEKGKKTEVCKKFMNSSNKGALLCVFFMKECGEVSPLGNKCEEICRWLSMVDDREKLKKDVFALSENTPEWFPALLDPSAHECCQPSSGGLTRSEWWERYGSKDYL